MSARASFVEQTTIEASSIGGAACSLIQKGRRGAVHSVYRGAINIEFSGRLLSVVSDLTERGPMNVNVRMPRGLSFLSLGCRVRDPVVVIGSIIHVGAGLAVAFGSASPYHSYLRFHSPALPKAKIEANLEVAKRTAIGMGRHSGLGGLLALAGGGALEPHPGSLNLFAAAALPRINALLGALRGGDPWDVRAAVKGLVGLGPGLTPSSDDMLAGMVLAILLHSKNVRFSGISARDLAGAVAEESRGRTTLLSAEYLRQAASGGGNEAVMKLCEALLSGDPDDAARETRSVLAIGESSGTDTVLGVVLGVELCLEKARTSQGRRT